MKAMEPGADAAKTTPVTANQAAAKADDISDSIRLFVSFRKQRIKARDESHLPPWTHCVHGNFEVIENKDYRASPVNGLRPRGGLNIDFSSPFDPFFQLDFPHSPG